MANSQKLSSFKFKSRLNWKVKDINPEVQAKNSSLYKVSIFAIFIFLVTLTPLYIYIYVISVNSNLSYFFKNADIINRYSDVPSKAEIVDLLWSAVAMIGVTLILLVFLKPLITMKNITARRQFSIISGITLSMIITLLLGALSQYSYSQFEQFFLYQAKTTGTNSLLMIQDLKGKVDEMNTISQTFTANYNAGIDVYKWQSELVVWWCMFIQLMFVFGIAVALQNKSLAPLSDDGIEKYIAYSSRVKNISTNKILKRLYSAFSFTDKKLSLWMVLSAGIALVPQLIFTIILSAPSTNVSSVIDWTYNVNGLLQDYEDADLINSAYNVMTEGLSKGSSFVLTSLPIIMTGITFSTSFFFISVMIRGERTAGGIFTIQYGVLLLELVIATAFTTYTKIETNNIANIWNGNDSVGNDYINVVRDTIGDSDFSAVVALHPLNNIEGQFGIEWLNGTGVIAETIIELSFIIGAFTTIRFGSIKARKARKIIEQEQSRK